MNKVNFLLMFLSFLINCSCDRKGVVDNTYEDEIINKTNKELFIVSYFDVKNDSAYCHGNDSVSLIFVKKVYFSHPIIGPYNIDEGEYPEPKIINIYNISDTTFFTGRSMTEDEKKLVISEYILGFRHHIEKLYITDGFLTLFKKDYSMLNKFKEFYKK